jgi:aspartyl protease family protein
MTNEYSKAARLMFLLGWLIFFVLTAFLFHFYQHRGQGEYEIKPGMVSISPDHHGHYYLDGHINGYPVKFLLDTGATLVAIPKNLAEKLNLRGHYPVTIKTANGEVTGYLTRLEELAFADFKLRNVKAIIGPADRDDLVLLGMNVLSKFNLSQQDRRLILKKTAPE